MTQLSVIIASQDARTTIETCLASFRQQNHHGAAEFIVVDNSSDDTPTLIEEKFPDVRLVRTTGRMLVPHLWARGSELASGRIVAFTTASCVPHPDWLSQILRHHDSQYAAIGGAIENAQPASPTQWAVYFCRYAPYMLPFPARIVEQVPGDNASYRRWVLDTYADSIRDGFWETVVTRRLRKDGHALLLTPDIRVSCGASFGLGAFCWQRLVHGMHFGAERAQLVSWGRWFFYVAFSPLVPFLFLAKITHQVFKKKRHYAQFAIALPLTVTFIFCWSVGEFLGYFQGRAQFFRNVRDPVKRGAQA